MSIDSFDIKWYHQEFHGDVETQEFSFYVDDNRLSYGESIVEDFIAKILNVVACQFAKSTKGNVLDSEKEEAPAKVNNIIAEQEEKIKQLEQQVASLEKRHLDLYRENTARKQFINEIATPDHVYVLYDKGKRTWLNWAEVLWVEPELKKFNRTYKSEKEALDALENFISRLLRIDAEIKDQRRETGYFTEMQITYFLENTTVVEILAEEIR
jgi:predicted RNase H-like nuclease (RuvC/YqgF family)